jgi:hypothetical protein
VFEWSLCQFDQYTGLLHHPRPRKIDVKEVAGLETWCVCELEDLV